MTGVPTVSQQGLGQVMPSGEMTSQHPAVPIVCMNQGQKRNLT